MMYIRPCDIETSGKEPTDEVLEIGRYDVIDGKLDLASGHCQFVRPARTIPPSASAIHHITDDDVADAAPWAEAWRGLVDNHKLPMAGVEVVYAAHFAQFERQWLDPLIKARWIDTWRCALKQWPGLESHSLQSIRYELGLPADPVLAFPPHRALPDAYVCGLLVIELLKHQSAETLIAWSSAPPFFTKFDFGKFSGKPLSAADDGWLDWYLNKATETNPDWRHNLLIEVERRAAVKRQTRIKKWLDGVALAATVRDLENWWHGEAEAFAVAGIIPGTEEYAALIGAAAARKAVLLAAPGPVFETSGAPT